MFDKVWGFLDGKKVIVGYLATQLLGENVGQALVDAGYAVAAAHAAGNLALALGPVAYAAAQLLLFVGVGHKVMKAKDSI